MSMEGLNRVMSNLSRSVSKIEGATVGGLLAGGLIIQGEAQRRVPVHYGKLRASAYTRKSPKRKEAVEVGFSAAYALWVHENLQAKLRGQPRKDGIGVYWGPKGEPQFLLKAANITRPRVLEAVRNYSVKAARQ